MSQHVENYVHTVALYKGDNCPPLLPAVNHLAAGSVSAGKREGGTTMPFSQVACGGGIGTVKGLGRRWVLVVPALLLLPLLAGGFFIRWDC